MIIKNKLSKLRKVGVSVWGKDKQNFSNGKNSVCMTIYDTTPDEVLKVIQKALSEQQ